MVSFLLGLNETERNKFLSFLDNLEREEKKLFIKSFNEKIDKEDLFKRISNIEIFGEGKRMINFHSGELNRTEKKSLCFPISMIELRCGFDERISCSTINISYTPEEPIKKEEIKSFFGSNFINIYKSKNKSLSLYKGEKDKRYIDFVNELKQEKHEYSTLKESEVQFFIQLNDDLSNLLNEWHIKFTSLKNQVTGVLDELDKDNNGQLDFIEGGGDYLPLLKKHQSKIVEIDRTYIQQFIKVSNYLTQKKQNLQFIFERLKDSVNQSQLDELGEILKQEIHTYNIILLNSLHMINSLVEDDMITFYEIHERFDKLNMFTSNWENQVTEKLEQVNVNLIDLMKELRDVGNGIVSSIEYLSFVTEESTRQITSKMEEIDSTLQVGNLLNLIQTYQMYKVNKNTKSLRE
jgi:hypothetical protein